MTDERLTWQCDPAGRFTHLHPGWVAALGFRPEEMLGKAFADFHDPETAQQFVGAFQSLMRGNTWNALNVALLDSQGARTRWVLCAAAVRDESGRVVGAQGCAALSSQLERTQDALRESEAKFSAAFHSSPVALVIAAREGVYVDVNPAFCRLIERPQDEILGKKSEELALFDDQTRQRMIEKSIQGGGSVRDFEATLCLQDGTRRHVVYSVEPISLAGAVHHLITAVDVTARVVAEKQIREREALFSAIFTSSPMLMAVARLADNRLLEVNRAFLDALGFEAEEVIGKSSQEVGLLADPVERELALAEIQERGSLRGFEMRLTKRDGAQVAVLASSEILDIGKEKCLLTSAIDISERKRAEEALVKSESLMRTALDNLPLIFYMIDVEGIFQLSIGAGLEALGLEPNQVVGLSAFKLYGESPEIIAALRRALAGERSTFETSMSGSAFFNVCVPAHGWFDGLVGVSLDITARKREEATLRRVQQLESLGVLAGGIAHDFNNLLTGILGHVDLARDATDDPDSLGILDDLMKAAERATGLTRQLLTFAKGGVPVREVTPIRTLVEESATFALSGSPVASRFSFAADLWSCHVDKEQIGQVIGNLAINGRQAMAKGGTLEIIADNYPCEESTHSLLAPGNYVRVRIKDSGPGIAADLLSRIFEPYFTTKAAGHGLGLAVCHSIVQRHGGIIEVESEPTKGCTFTLFLPASLENTAPASGNAIRHRGSGAFVVVDDQDLVRDTLRKMLAGFGYQVVAMTDGNQVIDFLRTAKLSGRFCSGVILDLTIPGGMGGQETVRAIREFDAEIPVFATSGYAEDEAMSRPTAWGFTASIAKPFTIAELSALLNRHMARSTNDGNSG